MITFKDKTAKEIVDIVTKNIGEPITHIGIKPGANKMKAERWVEFWMGKDQPELFKNGFEATFYSNTGFIHINIDA